MKGGLSKEVVSDEGEFSMGHTYVHLFPVRLVLRGGLTRGASQEILLYKYIDQL